MIDHLKPPVRRDDVDVIGMELLAILDLDDRHAGTRCQNA